MISMADLGRMQAIMQDVVMTTPCTLQRTGRPGVLTSVCAFHAVTTATTPPSGNRFNQLQRFTFLFPDVLDVALHDTVTTATGTWLLTELRDPQTQSFDVFTRAIGYQIRDGAGNWLYPQTNCTARIARASGAVVLDALPLRIDVATTEQIAAWGGAMFHSVTVGPPMVDLAQNMLLFVLTCPSNPLLVTASAAGWPISDVRQDGDPVLPATLFLAQQRVQP